MSELYHHGVKGQKWGVRRYRNANGTLTDAGKKRISKLEGKINKKAAGIEKRNAKIHKTALKNETKAAKWEAKANKTRNSAYHDPLMALRGRNGRAKYRVKQLQKADIQQATADMYRTKTEGMKQKNIKAEKKIVKYNTKISEIDSKHKTVGKQYVDNYIKRNQTAFDRAS